tara:strand:- start:787 stop:1230 length:444 start_codon:yes stop_codon:yes gene_type:complete
MSYSPNPQRAYLAASLIAIFFVCLVVSCTPAIASDVRDVFKTQTVQIPHTQRVCNDVYHGGDRTGDTLKGAIIGGIIGNNIKGEKDGGAIGAIIGGMLGHSNSDASPNVITQCRNITNYTTETREVYSHSIISFIHNGRHYKLRFQK